MSVGFMTKRFFFFIFVTLVGFSLTAFAEEGYPSFQEKFASAKEGDYSVTALEGHYCLLLIRALTPTRLLLEEVTVPERQIDLKKQNWQKWLNQKAPGHTSWTLYTIDRKANRLIDCFSYSKNGWIVLGEGEQFFCKLLSLPKTCV